MMRAPRPICNFFFGFFLILFLSSIADQPQHSQFQTTTWTNDGYSFDHISFSDGSRIRVILEEDSFACGFFCNGDCTSYLFAVVILEKDEFSPYRSAVIWSANREYPVREGAMLNLTAAGGLVLKDVDGSIVWTTTTSGKSTVGMNLTEEGNLVLFDGHNSTVWQSFDHPTDCLVPGQKLFQGQKLTTKAQNDSYSLEVTITGLFAYIGSTPPQVYYRHLAKEYMNTPNERSYIELPYLTQTSLIFSSESDSLKVGITPPFQPLYIKLMPDGHLKAFGRDSYNREMMEDLLTNDDLGECSYPLACGRNAICSGNKQCRCPMIEYFIAVDDLQPNMGCSRVTPLTCNATQHQHFIQLENIKYFTDTADMEDVDLETCKQECLTNCSCEAAIFKYDRNSSTGYCYLPTELFTMTRGDAAVLPYNASAFIKVQNVRSTLSSKKQVARVVGSTIGSFVLLLIVVVGLTRFILQKQKTISEIEEDYLDQVSGMPTRFSYQELKTATDNFSKKLGQGGYGSVFQGTLEDGSHIAVKYLQGLAHIKKSFLAEVESIGSIHHVNLVRLRGFCAWKAERLLVYEFMSNGSLDQWIYSGDQKHVLGWECRKKIILDIAKGLAYLHEDCRQKIIHLDIKPQNILLDDDFNAKVADFGLSKLIDRDQSQVMTKMRGTPGYMAPEWLSSIITEKVDVYSFGILLLEILCGRRIFDRYQQEDSWHLLCVFQRCWEHGTLLNIVKYSEDMDEHGTEVMEMMKVASWCLQTDFTKRPSMSSVVKVLEGIISVEPNLDYNFSYPRLQETINELEKSSKPMLPSILSGPR